MSIYFVQEENNSEGLIKIGLSIDTQKRLKSMQTNSPVWLQMLVTLPGNEGVEKTLHDLFVEDRVRGEWFKPTKQLLDFIDLAIEWRWATRKFSVTEKEQSWYDFYNENIVHST